ncbi:hypothetical protein GFS24_26700 [Chitinophaga sp. SYP-B3965]|uniref:hypothetical protein n=1 Tax=Chitinophaga sp. SYP-B3965 TaxID=2663120 RepID=UPI001299AE28|nr:hypothetical protein [Chitinophaga sp. SYP-B3965]MRG48730.1 hypothetical protein [Chitinophaga sp. SYP-B3965]
MNTYLETGIAVILIIVVFSIVAYVIQELIAVNLQFRGRMLKKAINQLLVSGSVFANEFFKHPQIELLEKRNGATKDPSYIPSANFAMTVIDLVKNGTAADPELQKLFSSWQAIAGEDVIAMKALIEKWYDEYMDRVGGWYKKEYRWITRILAIGIALAFNFNLIRITQIVHHDTALKATLVAAADKMADTPDYLAQYYTQKINSDMKAVDDDFATKISSAPADSAKLVQKRDAVKDSLLINYNAKQYQMARGLVDSLPTGKLMLGWKNWPWLEQEIKTGKPAYIGNWNLFLLIIGLFLGAAAISMGAPFWFALLVKLVNIRRAGLKPPVSK